MVWVLRCTTEVEQACAALPDARAMKEYGFTTTHKKMGGKTIKIRVGFRPDDHPATRAYNPKLHRDSWKEAKLYARTGNLAITYWDPDACFAITHVRYGLRLPVQFATLGNAKQCLKRVAKLPYWNKRLDTWVKDKALTPAQSSDLLRLLQKYGTLQDGYSP